MKRMSKLEAESLVQCIVEDYALHAEISSPQYIRHIDKADEEYYWVAMFYGEKDTYGVQECLIFSNKTHWEQFKKFARNVTERVDDYEQTKSAQAQFVEKERNFEQEAHDAHYVSPDF